MEIMSALNSNFAPEFLQTAGLSAPNFVFLGENFCEAKIYPPPLPHHDVTVQVHGKKLTKAATPMKT